MEIRNEVLVCDFCGEQHPSWVFPADDFSQDFENPDKLISLALLGSWAACDTCKELVDSNKRHQLATRTLSEYGELEPVTKRAVYKRLRQAHDEFFFNLHGDAISVEEYLANTEEEPGVTRFWDSGD